MMTASQSNSPLRVCYFGAYRDEYTRNQILIAGLQAQGVVVETCHSRLWRGIDDRVALASGGWRNRQFWGRVWRAYRDLWRAYRQTGAYDVMVVGYPGQFDIYLARLLTWLRRKPVVLDVFMSIHLVAEERGLTQRSPLTGWLLFQAERWGLRLADRLLMENAAYQHYVSAKYALPAARFRYVPLGADDRVCFPRPQRLSADTFRVLYFGTFLPSHGMDTLIDAAARLQGQTQIRFDFYGDGPEKARIMARAQELGLKQVSFHDFTPYDQLMEVIAGAHVCLGVFGMTPQAQMTVQNKLWETLALARPLISADSPAVRELFTHREHLYLVPRQNPIALAQAILELESQPAEREAMAQRGYEQYRRLGTVAAVGARFKAVLEELAQQSASKARG